MLPTPLLPAPAAVSADVALVEQVLAGDPQAFERLMRQHNRRLFRVARSILRNDADAEDAVQEGYLLAHRALPGYRGDARLATWLTRIVVNQALAQRRRRPAASVDGTTAEAAAATEAAAPLAAGPEVMAMRRDLRRLIEASIDGLPEPHRSVFVLRAVEGLSVAETSAALGISPANTKVRLLRARAQLREALGQRLGPLLESVFSFDGERCDRIVTRVFARLGLALPATPAGSAAAPTP